MVILFFCTWGTVFLARMSVLYLAPFIAPDLHLSHSQVGLLAAALAIAWAASGLIFGALSDRIGRRPILIPAVFLLSMLSWVSGLMRSFIGLFLARTAMGVAEGPTWPMMTAMIEAASEPRNRGRNIGIVVSAGALVGLALAPVLTAQIAARFGWRAAFFVVGLPGILLGFLIWKFVKEPSPADPNSPHHAKPTMAEPAGRSGAENTSKGSLQAPPHTRAVRNSFQEHIVPTREAEFQPHEAVLRAVCLRAKDGTRSTPNLCPDPRREQRSRHSNRPTSGCSHVYRSERWPNPLGLARQRFAVPLRTAQCARMTKIGERSESGG